MAPPLALVTGGSGFIAGHCILQLLDEGYEVRATLRSLSREESVRATLTEAGMRGGERLSFVAADLLSDDGWAEALDGVDGVLHVASPVQPGHVDDEDDLIVPAREGALRVLRAARRAGVRRVVLTSAFHAVSWGWPRTDHVFTEADWSVLDGPGMDAYGKSKTLSERAAWEFVAPGDAGAVAPGPELVTMLPVAVVGPVMGRDVSGANHLIQRILSGGLPALPDLYFPIVDVRDVARAHALALRAEGAQGERFLLSNGPALPMAEVASTIRSGLVAAGLADAASSVSTRRVPSLVVRAASLVNREFRSVVPDLGYSKKTSNDKARRVLGWEPRDPHEAIVAAAESLVARGLVTS